MNIRNYFKKINKKTDELSKTAQNPFLSYKNDINPFKGAFSQTYVWVEKEKEKKD